MDNFRSDSGIDTAEEQELKLQKPPLYRVVLLNDDYTTMDFVIHVLRTIFRKSLVEATQIMLHVHNRGAGIAGIYVRDIAETKISSVHRLARDRGFPLKCQMERE